MDDIAKRVEAGKADLIRKLMQAKKARRLKAKQPPEEEAAEVEEVEAEKPADGLTDDDEEELLRLYATKD